MNMKEFGAWRNFSEREKSLLFHTNFISLELHSTASLTLVLSVLNICCSKLTVKLFSIACNQGRMGFERNERK